MTKLVERQWISLSPGPQSGPGVRRGRGAHYSVAGRWGEEGVLVVDEEEVGPILVEGRGEVVGLRVHDEVGQAERRGQPVHRDLAVVRDVVGLEGNLDL